VATTTRTRPSIARGVVDTRAFRVNAGGVS
jgi:hypothetical protein